MRLRNEDSKLLTLDAFALRNAAYALNGLSVDMPSWLSELEDIAAVGCPL